MRTLYPRTALLILPFSIVAAQAAPIQNLTFTEVVKDVFVIDPATKKETPAKAGDTLVPPNVLKTGADSRAELVAEDKTVTRVGSNTIFSVEANSRDVNLAQGSVLFHSPAGRGGGRIKSAGATASVLGTTLAVSANASGGFKTSLLEGKGEVRDLKGGKVGLVAGQVTFAKPGGGLSPALNFDLKAQISNSKLVGGFSAPLASIAKIEAAVTVQQAKIAGGGLVSTGMLIGDRPDTAFKVDSAIVDNQVRQAKLRMTPPQIPPTKELKTFYEVDPRYLDSVVQSVHLSLDSTQNKNKDGQFLPNYSFFNEQTAPGKHIFIIDRTGRASLAPEIENAIGVVPSDLPGNQQDTSITYHALIANEITVSLSPTVLGATAGVNIATFSTGQNSQETRLSISSGGLPDWLKPGVLLSGTNLPPGTMVLERKEGYAILNQPSLAETVSGQVTGIRVPQFLLPIPLIDKVGGAMVARQDLDFSGAIEFVGVDNIETTPEGFEFGQTLLLSAGRTLKMAPGSMLVANTSLFEIYTAGTSFSGDVSLSVAAPNSGETAIPLKLDRVALVNRFPLDTSSNINGTIRVTAPSIELTDTLILAASDSSEISLRAAGDVSISTNRNATFPSELLLSLGITNLKDLCLKAFKVGIRSESKAIAINGVSIYANEITLRAGDTLTLSAVTIDPFDFQRPQNLTASAANTVSINSGSTSQQTPNQFNPAAIRTDIYSDNADVIIKDTEFGSPPSSEISNVAVDSKTSFTARASGGDISMISAKINADSVELFGGKTIMFEGVSMAPTDSSEATIKVSARDLSAKTSTFKAYKIVMDAQNEMHLQDLAVSHVDPTKENEFKATAVNKLDMSRVDLRYAQNVALEANTIILENVSFKAGSNVTLTSQSGVLSTPTQRANVTKGWVNILPNVMYGNYDLNRLSQYMDAHGIQPPLAATKGIPAEAFKNAVVGQVKTDHGVDLSKITVKAKSPLQ
jgi:hypothetical protein